MKNSLTKTLFSLLAFSLPLLMSSVTVSAATPEVQAAGEKGEVTFYVTRHGKTLFNAAHRAQGWSDTPLTSAGVEVAEQLGRGLKDIHFAAAFSSDAGRARQTAKIALASAGQPLPVSEDQRLRETFFGPFEGEHELLMWEPVAKKLGYKDFAALTQALNNGQVTLKTMMDTLAEVDPSHTTENAAQVHQRMQAALTDIARKVSAQGGGNVLIVSHGMAILAMLEGMTPEENLRAPLQNASVTVITYKDGQFTVGKIGDMHYVEKGKGN